MPNESPEDAAKVAVVSAQSTLDEFVKRVRRDPESGRKLNEGDLQEVFRCVRILIWTFSFSLNPVSVARPSCQEAARRETPL